VWNSVMLGEIVVGLLIVRSRGRLEWLLVYLYECVRLKLCILVYWIN